MTIFIKDLSGHSKHSQAPQNDVFRHEANLLLFSTAITMSVPGDITISNLTTLLSLRTSLPESSLRLVHAGKHISSQDTDRSLSDCHIGRESTLHLAAPLRGGGPKKIRCTHKDCKGAAQRIVGDCGFCNGHFCDKHRLLEDHKCTGLEDVSALSTSSDFAPKSWSSNSSYGGAAVAGLDIGRNAQVEAKQPQWWLIGLEPELLADMMS
jgi:hypothetical protein